MQLLKVYTDGSASHINRCGGVGVFIETPSFEDCVYISEPFYPAKVGKMEIRAFRIAVEYLSKDPNFWNFKKVSIYSDSQYVVKSFNKKNAWVKGWIRRGVIEHRKNKTDLKEAYYTLQELRTKINVEIKWVKGHSGVLGNEIADCLAGMAFDQMKIQKGF